MRNNKMGEKIPSFFHHDNKANSPQILVDAPLIIKDSELLDLLNAPIDKDEKYHLLISCIRSHSPKYLNQRIMVKSHTTIEGNEHTPPAGHLWQQKENTVIQPMGIKITN